MIYNIIEILILVIPLLLWFFIMYYIGSSKTKRIYFKKIKNTEQRIKDLFDGKKILPADVVFFSYGTKSGSVNIIMHVFWIVLSFCLIYPLLGILADYLFPELSILQYIIPVFTGILVIYWRYSLNIKFIKNIKERKYRCGVFILRDELIVREDGWPICHIIPKNCIVQIEHCSIWTSDSSEDAGISITVTPGEGTERGEIVILGQFFSVSGELVLDYIRKWRWS